jgi:hypothetical protein
MKNKLTYLVLFLGIVFIYPLVYQPVHGMLDHTLTSSHHCCDEMPVENDAELLKSFEECPVCEYEIAAFSVAGSEDLPEVTISYCVFQTSPATGFLTSGSALLPDPRGPPQV